MSLGEWRRRVWYALNRSRLERELEAEMAAHREMMQDRRAFGNTLKLREEARDAWGWGPLDRLGQDLRQAARSLRHAPSFSITAIVILSAGMGLNLTFFHLLNVTSLQPLPVKDPATLVRLERRGKTFSSSGVPFPATQFIREHNEVLSAVLTHRSGEVAWDGDPASKVEAAFVSANWFRELGYDAAAGRVFSEAVDEAPGAAAAAIISDGFWRTRLGSSPDAVGATLRLNGRPATIIGVAPANFPDLDLRNPQVWLPIQQIEYFEPGSAFKDAWNDNNTNLYARVRPGIAPAAAEEGLRPAIIEMSRARPREFQPDEWLEGATAEGRFLHRRDRQKMLGAAGLVGGLTLLVLLVASANLANLVLSHAIGRVREFSVRLALGASRWRILRQIVVECALLAATGALGGIALSYAGARLFAAVTELPPYLDFTPDGGLLVAAFGAALASMLAFGVVPAWMISRRDLMRGIRDGGHQVSAGLARARLRVALVGAQVVGCCALLVVAGSMARGVQRLLATDPGFRFARIAVVDPGLARHGINGEAAATYWSEVSALLASHPDVEALALTSLSPLGAGVHSARYGADSGPLTITVMKVEPSFFRVMDIPIVAGRAFAPGDDPSSVVISRRLAVTMYGTLDVLGKRYPRTDGTRTIVGVSADAMVVRLHVTNAAEEYMAIEPQHLGVAVLLAKSRTNPEGLLRPLHEAAQTADKRIQPSTRLLSREYERNLRGPKLAGTIAALTAALVLALACFGIFGVVAYGVKLRTKEIGIRRALGADARRVCQALLRQLAWPVGVGVIAGTTAGVLASRLLGGPPLHLAVIDAAAPGAALALFTIAALAAALLPAVRALDINPVEALRNE